jgi:hypothetical protein
MEVVLSIRYDHLSIGAARAAGNGRIMKSELDGRRIGMQHTFRFTAPSISCAC